MILALKKKKLSILKSNWLCLIISIREKCDNSVLKNERNC